MVLAAALLCVGSSTAANGDTTWTLAGTGAAADTGDGGQAREAAINQPRSIFATATGGYVWAEPFSNKVRIVRPDGVIATLAGTGTAGSSGDGGQAAAAELNFVHSAAPTPDGGYLIADTLNSRIRKVSAAGIITTVAGTGGGGYGGDGGQATSALINNPRGVVSLADGSFLIPDSNNHRVRKVSPSGVITTVAGTGNQGFSGDGGPATAAQLSIPFGIAPTADGGFLIVDVGNQRIRKVSAGGTITTVAGNGVAGFSGDGGPATAASLRDPHNAVALSDGSFLIADASNQRVRRVAADGIITTLIGDGVRGYTGDGGPAAAAQVSVPKGVSVTAAGDVLIADEQNNRIRFIGTVVAPASAAAPSVSGQAVQGQTLTATAGGWSGTGPIPSYRWQRCSPGCLDIAGASGNSYLVAAADVGATLRAVVTASNSAGSSEASSAQTALVIASGATTVTFSIAAGGDDGDVQVLGNQPGRLPADRHPRSQLHRHRRHRRQTARIRPVPRPRLAPTLQHRLPPRQRHHHLRQAPRLRAQQSRRRRPQPHRRVVRPRKLADRQRRLGTQPRHQRTRRRRHHQLHPQHQRRPHPQQPHKHQPHQLHRPPTRRQRRPTHRRQPLPNRRPRTQHRPRTTTHHHLHHRRWQRTAPVNTAAPAVSGVAQQGQTLTASTGTWSGTAPISYSYQWQRCSPGCLRHRRRERHSYLVAAADVGASLRVVVTGSNSAGSGTASSAQTAVVTASGTPPANTSPPTISGLAQLGPTLTADEGSWSGTAPISYTYQWRRCDAAGSGCVDIAGAVGSSYLVVAADVGSSLRVAVTASNGSSVYASAVSGDAPRSYWRFGGDERRAGRRAGRVERILCR